MRWMHKGQPRPSDADLRTLPVCNLGHGRSGDHAHGTHVCRSRQPQSLYCDAACMPQAGLLPSLPISCHDTKKGLWMLGGVNLSPRLPGNRRHQWHWLVGGEAGPLGRRAEGKLVRHKFTVNT